MLSIAIKDVVIDLRRKCSCCCWASNLLLLLLLMISTLLWRDLASPLTRPWRKNCPTPLQTDGFIARAFQTSGSTHYPPGWALLLLCPHSGTSSTCDPVNHATFENHVIFLTVFGEYSCWRASMQVTVGECHPKKIWCMLGALQSAFPALLPKGGDALMGIKPATVAQATVQHQSRCY